MIGAMQQQRGKCRQQVWKQSRQPPCQGVSHDGEAQGRISIKYRDDVRRLKSLSCSGLHRTEAAIRNVFDLTVGNGSFRRLKGLHHCEDAGLIVHPLRRFGANHGPDGLASAGEFDSKIGILSCTAPYHHRRHTSRGIGERTKCDAAGLRGGCRGTCLTRKATSVELDVAPASSSGIAVRSVWYSALGTQGSGTW